jgi:hypothetical protein
MSELTGTSTPVGLQKYKWWLVGLASALIAAIAWPREFLDTLIYVLEGMLAVSYLVIPGILVSA